MNPEALPKSPLLPPWPANLLLDQSLGLPSSQHICTDVRRTHLPITCVSDITFKQKTQQPVVESSDKKNLPVQGFLISWQWDIHSCHLRSGH